MKTFRTTLLITGILVAWLAFNTAFGQSHAPERNTEKELYKEVRYAKAERKLKKEENRFNKAEFKRNLSIKPVYRNKSHVDKQLKKELKTVKGK